MLVRCIECGHQLEATGPGNCAACGGRTEPWSAEAEKLRQKMLLKNASARRLTQEQAAIRIQRFYRLTRGTEATLFGERAKGQAVTEQRQSQLIKIDKNYLAGLYGLRVIASMTGREHEPDLWISNEFNTSYLRDAYEKVWGSLKGGGKTLILNVVTKLMGKTSEGKTLYWLVNSPDVLGRLSFLSTGSRPVLSARPRIVATGEPGLHVLAYELADGKFTKPWDPESGANSSAGDIFVDYLKFVGATPSSYQMYRFLRDDDERGEPLIDENLSKPNRALLAEILSSPEFGKLRHLAESHKAMQPVFEASVGLIRGLETIANGRKFNKGVLVKNSLEILYNLVKVFTYYFKNAERCRRIYDLVLDELFLILAAVSPYGPNEISEAEAAIQDTRAPSLKKLFASKRAPVSRRIHPAWSGMDALTTALEIAIATSGADVQLLGEGGQATYFEVGCVLAAQGRLRVSGNREDTENLPEPPAQPVYPAVLMATMISSTPLMAGPTPDQIAAIAMARYQRLNPSGSARSKPISLIVDATIQLPESVEPVRQLELLVQRLSEPIQRGQVQLIIARSYQKYQALGSGKMMGGCTTLIHANAIAAGAAFLRRRDSSSFRGLDEVQFFTHILKHAAPSELSMAGTATRNASTLAAELFPNPMVAQVTSPFVVRGDMTKWIQRLAIAEMDSFGLVASSYLDLTFMGIIRMNPGMESRERLYEKFFAAGRLWGDRHENSFNFNRVIHQIRGLLDEVNARYGTAGRVRKDWTLERAPFRAATEPAFRYARPTPAELSALYRIRPANYREPGSDLDHSLASYLSLTFRFSKPLVRNQGKPTTHKAIITLADDDKLYLAGLCCGLFRNGLLECVTPEMRAELGAHWLRLLLELDTEALALRFVEQNLAADVARRLSEADPVRPIMEALVAKFGGYTPAHVRRTLLEEAKASKARRNSFAPLVEEFLTRTTPLLDESAPPRATLLSPGVDRPRPLDPAILELRARIVTMRGTFATLLTNLIADSRKKSTKGFLTEGTRLKIRSLWDRLEKDQTALAALTSGTDPAVELKVRETVRYLEPMLDELIDELRVATRQVPKSSAQVKKQLSAYASRLDAARKKLSIKETLARVGSTPPPARSTRKAFTPKPTVKVSGTTESSSAPSSSSSAVADTHWYTDDEIDALLRRRLHGVNNVYLMNGVDARQHSGYTLLDNLREARNAIRNSVVRTIVLPVNVRGNHWTALHLRFEADDAQRESPVVRYADPMGSAIPDTVRNSVLQIFRTPDIRPASTVAYQHDGYNCGPWTVALLQHMAQNDGALPRADAIDIGQRRTEDSQLLQ